MSPPGVDLVLYGQTVELLQEHAEKWHNEHGAPQYGDAVHSWCTRLGLDPDGRGYVTEGLMRLAGHPQAAGWDNRPRQPELDGFLWTFYRAWVDHYGPIYPPDTTPTS